MFKIGKNSPVVSNLERQPYLLSINAENRIQTRLARMMHVHDDRVEILQMQSGHGVHIIDGKEYKTKQGDILIYNAGAKHEEFADSENGMDILSCAIGNVCIKGLAPNVLFPKKYSPVIQNRGCYHEVGTLMGMLHTNFLSRSPSTELEYHLLCSLLLTIREIVMREESEEEQKEQELGHLIQSYIDEHYIEDISLQDIADELNMNQYYISHAFKSTTGLSPMQYVIRRRIGEAQSYLLNTDKTVTEIAYIVGYNSASNFNNAFKKMIGMSPQRYRKLWRNQP
ncbi:transcriptional regulator, AraC family protein [Neobacillus vireti LMG 21834]|uniref:Transcriptional regulator, AraC family protein n=1 Tax=Neobacillus vireti LMG 21834 TaxID=1131730 RepID=A0AB94ISI4_9BACI|nr:transcriptional regulator, AraC family protein [Neobacillus vireti LMG 21834]